MAAYIPAPSWVDSSKVDGSNIASAGGNKEQSGAEDATAKLGLREDENGALIHQFHDDKQENVQIEVSYM
jgi:hypothetical protein